jgi:protein-S-isoprenylcysteine O-methyltransferase Ste14
MRNPIRLKNLSPRFLPVYAIGALVLVLTRPSLPGFAAGLLLVTVGAALRGWGAGHLVKNDQLTVTGPYAYMRHPLYAGTLLIAIGFSAIVGGWVAVGLLALLLPWFFLDYFPRKDRIESARLERLYGDSYARYRAEVPALLPRLKPWRGDSDRILAAGQVSGVRWSRQLYSGNNELGTLLALVAGIGAFALRVVLPQ